MNILLSKEFRTPHNTIPFSEIHIEDYEPAMMEGMRQENAAIQSIIDNPEEPTFDNVIAPRTDELLSLASNIFFNQISCNTCDELDELAQKMSPILTEHSNRILLNENLWKKVSAVHDNPRELNEEESMLLDRVYEGFLQNGACLSSDDKKTFSELRMKLAQLTLQFNQNNLKDTNAFLLHLNDEKDMEGLPESSLEAGALAAKEKGLDGWIFTLHAPSYIPFMQYAKNRELRRKMYMAHNTISCHGDEFDNKEITRQIVNLRRQIAQLLGFNCHADYVLTHRCAEKKENVYRLLHQLLNAYKPQAEKEVALIQEIARKMEGPDFMLQPWDFAYYSHKLKMQLFNIDAEMLRPYFELSRVIMGVFGLATRLYGITFKSCSDIPVYHPDVEAYEVYDENESFLAVLYVDFHPRNNKQSGAWMTSYKEQYIDEQGVDHRPHVSLVMNLTKPTKEKPALLTLGEVETFLHEFGHALHGIFSRVHYESLSCTNVYWDFVELPSQFMENYAVEPDFLNTFARHYKTGEPIPPELIQRIRDSRNFLCGYSCVRQVSLGLLDMAYYTLTEELTSDILQFEKEAMASAQLFPQLPDTCMSVQFGHIMSGGYAAGYYSYKWAEVLDADAFSLFQQKGIFDRETAQGFRDEVLSRGGTRPPMELYYKFRGQEPTIDALLKRNGISV